MFRERDTAQPGWRNVEKWVGSRAPLEAQSGNPEGCWGDSSVDNTLAQSNEAPNSDPSTQVKRQKWWCAAAIQVLEGTEARGPRANTSQPV